MNGVATLQALRRFELHTGVRLPNPARLLSAVKVERLKPRESAFVEAEACSRVFVVRSGFLKQLYIKGDGSEWIKSFTGPGDLFACLEGLAGRRTTFASEAVEPSVVESVEWRIVEELAEVDVVWQKAVRLGFQYLAQMKVRRERDLLMLTAEELYRQFVRDSPALAQRVSQRDLAAFLGVTPVGLNRIVRRNAGLVKGRDDASATSAEGQEGSSRLVD
jgi:CRP-like cAMP-binding protein